LAGITHLRGDVAGGSSKAQQKYPAGRGRQKAEAPAQGREQSESFHATSLQMASTRAIMARIILVMRVPLVDPP
jgi:hypothetical protein